METDSLDTGVKPLVFLLGNLSSLTSRRSLIGSFYDLMFVVCAGNLIKEYQTVTKQLRDISFVAA